MTADATPERGYFFKRDLFERLHRLDCEIVPSLYDRDRLPRLLSEVDGVLIPGGLDDVDPSLYGESKKYDRVRICRERCDFEFDLLERTLKADLPLLGICWGSQILNVFMGGSLIQDLPNDRPSEIDHEQKTPSTEPHHFVDFHLSGEVPKQFQVSRLHVNSTHHQGIGRLGKQVIIEGLAEDGLPECFRIEGSTFSWAVQWHPERLAGDPFIPEFIATCRKRS